MKKLHLITGLAMVLIFVLSGQYLKHILPPWDGILDGTRMLYRASHIYLMMAAVVNVMAGIYYQPLAGLLAGWLQRIGSLAVILSQALLLIAFIIEPEQNPITRPYTLAGCLLLLFGAFFVFLGWCYQQYKTNK